METLRHEIDRAFEHFGLRDWNFPFTRFSFLPGRAARAYPLLNISEDGQKVYVDALAPGLVPESLKVTVVRGQLTIAGEKSGPGKEIKPESYHRSERAEGKFMRTFSLSTDVDEAKVTAEYKNGLLTITLPKAEAAKAKQIPVRVA